MQGARMMWDGAQGDPVDPAHVIPRSLGGCNHEDCTVGLPRRVHRAYDRGEVDLLPYLSHDEQAHAVSHVGILSALKITTGDNYVPEHGEAA